MNEHFPQIASIVNFLILIGVLVYFLRKPVSGFLVNRSKQVEDNIRESETLREKALEMLQAYQKKIDALDEEVEKILNRAKKDGASEKEKILERAERLAQQIVEDAKRNAQRESALMRKKIEKQFIERALKQAEDQIKEKASEDEHQVFLENFLNQMEQGRGINR